MSSNRWKDDTEVDKCFNCSATFSMLKRKHHCRSCGYIYCSSCTKKTVIPEGRILVTNNGKVTNDSSHAQLCCKICIKSFTNPTDPTVMSPPKFDRSQSTDRVKGSKSPDVGSNLTSFSPVESLLALSNQMTMSQLGKSKAKSPQSSQSYQPKPPTRESNHGAFTKSVSVEGANTAACNPPDKHLEGHVKEEVVREYLHSKSHISFEAEHSKVGPVEPEQANEMLAANYDNVSDDLDNDDRVDKVDDDCRYNIDTDISAASGLVSDDGEIENAANVVTRAISLDELSL